VIDFLRGYDIGKTIVRLELAARTDESCGRKFILPRETWERLERQYCDVNEHFTCYGVTPNGEFERLTKSMDALKKYVRK
jgi:hypothetical protein